MYKLKLFLCLAVSAAVLGACSTQASTPPAVETVSPTAQATATEVPATNECLNCHTEKQSLIDTAKPVVAVEAESKGVG